MKEFAASCSAALDVMQRLLIWIGLAIVLIAPGWVPLLDRFVIETTEVNILGQKLKVTDTRRLPGASVPGLTIEDGKVKLNGEDISLLPGERDRLRSEVATLRADKLALSRQLEDASRQMSALARAPTQQPAQQQALEQLAQGARQAVESVQPVGAARPSPTAAPAAPPTQAAVAGFMVLLASDTTAGAGGALDEVTQARTWVKANAPEAKVQVFRRNSYYATAVVFAHQDAAQAALRPLRQAFRSDAYIAEVRSWCPAALRATPRREEGLEVIDCGF